MVGGQWLQGRDGRPGEDPQQRAERAADQQLLQVLVVDGEAFPRAGELRQQERPLRR